MDDVILVAETPDWLDYDLKLKMRHFLILNLGWNSIKFKFCVVTKHEPKYNDERWKTTLFWNWDAILEKDQKDDLYYNRQMTYYIDLRDWRGAVGKIETSGGVKKKQEK